MPSLLELNLDALKTHQARISSTLQPQFCLSLLLLYCLDSSDQRPSSSKDEPLETCASSHPTWHMVGSWSWSTGGNVVTVTKTSYRLDMGRRLNHVFGADTASVTIALILVWLNRQTRGNRQIHIKKSHRRGSAKRIVQPQTARGQERNQNT